MKLIAAFTACLFLAHLSIAQEPGTAQYEELMQNSWKRASQHGGTHHAILSPGYEPIFGGYVPVESLQRQQFKILGGMDNDPERLRNLIRKGVDGILTDRPDLVQKFLAEEALSAKTDDERKRLANFDVQAHRGGRGFRPENTLPAFENGMDMLVTTLEFDTGVTADHVSLVWHDEFLSPKACRRTDGKPYTEDNRVFVHDISLQEAQNAYICDKTYFGPEQKNDLSLSPVAVAFAKQEGMLSPYVPTYTEQVFRFVRFYAEYYRSGPGSNHPQATARAAEADHVRFNIETKLIPDYLPKKKIANPRATDKLVRSENNTVGPQEFVDALLGAIKRNHMEDRVMIESFDFRTLKLVEEQFPNVPTCYLTANRRFFPFQVLQKGTSDK